MIYTCSMHPEIQLSKAGTCPKCGMKLVKNYSKAMTHESHSEHIMKPISKMSFWEKLKMAMTMTMGMDHRYCGTRDGATHGRRYTK